MSGRDDTVSDVRKPLEKGSEERERTSPLAVVHEPIACQYSLPASDLWRRTNESQILAHRGRPV